MTQMFNLSHKLGTLFLFTLIFTLFTGCSFGRSASEAPDAIPTLPPLPTVAQIAYVPGEEPAVANNEGEAEIPTENTPAAEGSPISFEPKWGALGGNSQHTFHVPGSHLNQAISAAWNYTENADGNPAGLRHIVVDETYITFVADQKLIVTLDRKTGELLNQIDITQTGRFNLVYTLALDNGNVLAAVAQADQSFGSFDPDSLQNNSIIAYRLADGAELWSGPVDPAGTIYGPGGPLLIDDGIVFQFLIVPTGNEAEGSGPPPPAKKVVRALNSSTGEVVWEKEVAEDDISIPFAGVIAHDKMAILANNHLITLDKQTGGEITNRPIDDGVQVGNFFQMIMFGDENVFIPCSSVGITDFIGIIALDVNGNEQWRFGDQCVRVGFHNGKLFTHSRKALTALDAKTGALLWEYEIPSGDILFPTEPVITDDQVIFWNSENIAHVFDQENGTLLWKVVLPQTPNTVSKSPIIVVDDHFYIHNDSFEIYAYR